MLSSTPSTLVFVVRLTIRLFRYTRVLVYRSTRTDEQTAVLVQSTRIYRLPGIFYDEGISVIRTKYVNLNIRGCEVLGRSRF